MSGIADMFSNAVQKVTGKTPQEHADAAKEALGVPPSVGTDAGVAKAMGLPKDPAGQTITGGKRLRRKHLKTRKGGKRSRKATRRR